MRTVVEVVVVVVHVVAEAVAMELVASVCNPNHNFAVGMPTLLNCERLAYFLCGELTRAPPVQYNVHFTRLDQGEELGELRALGVDA